MSERGNKLKNKKNRTPLVQKVFTSMQSSPSETKHSIIKRGGVGLHFFDLAYVFSLLLTHTSSITTLFCYTKLETLLFHFSLGFFCFKFQTQIFFTSLKPKILLSNPLLGILCSSQKTQEFHSYDISERKLSSFV